MENSKFLLRNKRFLATPLQKVAKKCENSTKNTTAKISQGKGQQFEENNTESLQNKKQKKSLGGFGWTRTDRKMQSSQSLEFHKLFVMVFAKLCIVFIFSPKRIEYILEGNTGNLSVCIFSVPFNLKGSLKCTNHVNAHKFYAVVWKTMFRPPKQSSTTDEERGILISLVWSNRFWYTKVCLIKKYIYWNKPTRVSLESVLRPLYWWSRLWTFIQWICSLRLNPFLENYKAESVPREL